jgi:hypothetical protein
MHREPNAHDRPALDSDSVGYDPREHEHGQHAVPTPVPAYVVVHHDRVVSPTYATRHEAELFRIFDTPGTASYAVRPVTASPNHGA